MKIEVIEGLYYGDEEICSTAKDISVVHACKHPCFAKAVLGEKWINNSLFYQRGHSLFLNLIDPEKPLFLMRSFEEFLKFVDAEIKDREVYVHCNKGRSRSPSLILIYLARRLDFFPNKDYEEAAKLFRDQFPYEPSRGIKIWLKSNWDRIK